MIQGRDALTDVDGGYALFLDYLLISGEHRYFSEITLTGQYGSSDCGEFRTLESVTVNCFGGEECFALNLWRSGWRPDGYREGVTVVNLIP
jgi:hypothetical protein